MTAAGRFRVWGHAGSGLVLGGHALGPGLQWVRGLPGAALGTSFLSEEVVRLPRAPRDSLQVAPSKACSQRGRRESRPSGGWPSRVGLRSVRPRVLGASRSQVCSLSPVPCPQTGARAVGAGGGSEALQVLLCGEFRRCPQNEKTRERICSIWEAGHCFGLFSVGHDHRVPFLL